MSNAWPAKCARRLSARRRKTSSAPDFSTATSAGSSTSHEALSVNLLQREEDDVAGDGIALTSGHRLVLGTPEEVADQLEDWFVNEGCDDYNVAPPYLPGGFDDFVNLVVPELQKRGLVRREYDGSTLRDHLGLPRPQSHRAAQHAKSSSRKATA